MKKEEIIATIKKHPYLDFNKHKDLLAMTVCSEYFCAPDEATDFTELLFAVEKEWLFGFIKQEYGAWSMKRIKQWLQEEYTSEDSTKIFFSALINNAIVMFNFN